MGDKALEAFVPAGTIELDAHLLDASGDSIAIECEPVQLGVLTGSADTRFLGIAIREIEVRLDGLTSRDRSPE